MLPESSGRKCAIPPSPYCLKAGEWKKPFKPKNKTNTKREMISKPWRESQRATYQGYRQMLTSRDK